MKRKGKHAMTENPNQESPEPVPAPEPGQDPEAPAPSEQPGAAPDEDSPDVPEGNESARAGRENTEE